MYNLAVAEDTVTPQKFKVRDYPAIRDFPAKHPNRKGAGLENGRAADEL